MYVNLVLKTVLRIEKSWEFIMGTIISLLKVIFADEQDVLASYKSTINDARNSHSKLAE